MCHRRDAVRFTLTNAICQLAVTSLRNRQSFPALNTRRVPDFPRVRPKTLASIGGRATKLAEH